MTMQTTAVRPPLNLPQAGVAAAQQPATAIQPPIAALANAPAVTLPSTAMTYGAGGADSRPY